MHGLDITDGQVSFANSRSDACTGSANQSATR